MKQEGSVFGRGIMYYQLMFSLKIYVMVLICLIPFIILDQYGVNAGFIAFGTALVCLTCMVFVMSCVGLYVDILENFKDFEVKSKELRTGDFGRLYRQLRHKQAGAEAVLDNNIEVNNYNAVVYYVTYGDRRVVIDMVSKE